MRVNDLICEFAAPSTAIEASQLPGLDIFCVAHGVYYFSFFHSPTKRLVRPGVGLCFTVFAYTNPQDDPSFLCCQLWLWRMPSIAKLTCRGRDVCICRTQALGERSPSDPPSKTHGVAYLVPEDQAEQVLAGLDFREKGGYTRATVDVYPTSEGGLL